MSKFDAEIKNVLKKLSFATEANKEEDEDEEEEASSDALPNSAVGTETDDSTNF